MIKEACVETINQCIKAEVLGASRIELCADLLNDGLTPDYDTISIAYQQLSIPIRVMIRPRAGDFIYTKEEVKQMKADIGFCKNIGVEGVVFGVCTAHGTLDISVISELAKLASPLKVTIHKAIDHCADPIGELKKLNTLQNIDAILTSGQSKTAIDGLKSLKLFLTNARSDIEIIACGKITKDNVHHLHQELGAKAYHGKRIVGDLEVT